MGREIDLLVNYPKSKRDVKRRGVEKTEGDRSIAKKFGKEFFDGDRRHGYGGFSYNPRFWQPVIPTFQKHFRLTSSSSILDVGCGKGFMLHDIAELVTGIKVKGVDISEYAVENAIEKSVIKALSKKGAKPAKAAIHEATEAVKKNLQADTVEDELTRTVANDINEEFILKQPDLDTKANEANLPEEIIDEKTKKAAKKTAKEKGGTETGEGKQPIEFKTDPDLVPKAKEKLLDLSRKPIKLGDILTSGEGAAAEALKKSFGDHNAPLVTFLKQPSGKAAKFLQTDVHPLPEKAININFSKIETTDDIKEIITKTSKVFESDIQIARRDIQTNEQTAALADNLGMTVADLLKRRAGQAFNAEEALAARRLLVASAERLREMAVGVGLGTASDFDKMAFRRQLSLHYAIQSQVSGMTAEAGRALQSFNIMSSSVSEVKQLFDNLTIFESKHGYSITDIANRLSAIDTIEGMNTAVRQAQKATTSDMLLEAWINGLLSNPVTHAVNTTSNQLVAFWQIPERLLASGIGKVFGNQEIKAQESLYQAYGMINGLKDSFRMTAKVLKTGQASDSLGKIEVSRYRAISSENLDISGVPGRAVDLLGETIRIPSRLLMAEDEFFKGMGYRMELHARAFRQAHAEGLKGKELSGRIQDIINNPPEDIHLAAVDASHYQTFTKELGGSGKKLQSFFNSHPALKIVVPFFRTPTNVFKFFGERTPLGLMSNSIRMDIAAGGAARDLALSRMALGSSVMALTAYYTAAGMITGAGPSDPGTRALLRDTGWQPYSVKIGDTYYAYGRLEPLGTLMGVGADIAEIMGQLESGDIDLEKLPAVAIMALSRNVTQKTFLEGLSSIIEAIEDPDRYGERYIQKLVGSLVPSGVAQINRINDPVLKEVDTVLDQIKSRVPGWGKDLPPRRNIWGEPIVLGGALGPDIVSPVYTSQQKTSPVSEELLKLKLPLSMPTRNIGGIKLTPKEYDRYVVLAGNEAPNPSTDLGLKDTLTGLIEDPDYRSQSDAGKALVIQKYVHVFRELAKRQLLDENPELTRLINEAQMQKQEALMP